MNLDEPGSIHYIFLLILLFLSGFFSSAEVAFVSLSPAKVRSLVQQKKRGAHIVETLKNNPERVLITVLIGNNIVNILIPVLSTVIFTKIFGNEIIGILTGILTLLILIFGEIFPKALAQKYAAGVSLFSGPLILVLSKILFPVVWLFEKLLHVLSKKNENIEKTFSDQELLALAEIGEEEGELETDERARIENVLEFRETTAEEVMTPRPKMDVLQDTTTLRDAVKFFLEKTHTRIPIYRETIDNITGVLTLKNILHLSNKYSEEKPLSELPVKKPLRIPMSMALEDVLKKMKWEKTHMAIVIDEHGGTEGLVTLEDLLEEVFGEIQDETDTEEEEIKKITDTDFLILGSAELEEIKKQTGFEVPGEASDSIAKVILDELGRFPKRGEQIQLTQNISAVVEKMDENIISSVRLLYKS